MTVRRVDANHVHAHGHQRGYALFHIRGDTYRGAYYESSKRIFTRLWEIHPFYNVLVGD